LTVIDDSVLARMITTIDDATNGFRVDLIPMALSSSGAAETSLLQATLALASFHLGRPEEALRHKVQAIKSLSDSFQQQFSSKLAQFAACMMLCVYSVSVKPFQSLSSLLAQVFDASDNTWQLHLQGARTLTSALAGDTQEPTSLHFFASWFAYHDTFCTFSNVTSTGAGPLLNIELPVDNGFDKLVRVCTVRHPAPVLRLIDHRFARVFDRVARADFMH
jgi:hypothetical protein